MSSSLSTQSSELCNAQQAHNAAQVEIHAECDCELVACRAAFEHLIVAGQQSLRATSASVEQFFTADFTRDIATGVNVSRDYCFIILMQCPAGNRNSVISTASPALFKL